MLPVVLGVCGLFVYAQCTVVVNRKLTYFRPDHRMTVSKAERSPNETFGPKCDNRFHGM